MTLADRVRLLLHPRTRRDAAAGEGFALAMLGYAARSDHPWNQRPPVNEPRSQLSRGKGARDQREQEFDGNLID